MSDLSRRPSSPPSRRSREAQAFRLVTIAGGAGAVAVVTFVLAIAGVLGFGIPILAALISALCFVLFRRAVGK
jgi:hypothetical protein